MDEWLELARALSDENRVRALLLLGEGELCACHIIAALGLAPSTVSAHMAVLQRAGLVKVRKEGRWRHYSIEKPAPASMKRRFLRLMADSAGRGGRAAGGSGRRGKAVSGTPAREAM